MDGITAGRSRISFSSLIYVWNELGGWLVEGNFKCGLWIYPDGENTLRCEQVLDVGWCVCKLRKCTIPVRTVTGQNKTLNISA